MKRLILMTLALSTLFTTANAAEVEVVIQEPTLQSNAFELSVADPATASWPQPGTFVTTSQAVATVAVDYRLVQGQYELCVSFQPAPGAATHEHCERAAATSPGDEIVSSLTIGSDFTLLVLNDSTSAPADQGFRATGAATVAAALGACGVACDDGTSCHVNCNGGCETNCNPTSCECK